MLTAYKLFKKRKDGSLGSLFVNARQKLIRGEWHQARNYHPKNLKERPGWHCLLKPFAPHLSEKNRVWCLVEIKDVSELSRPKSQGGKWLLANHLRIIKELPLSEFSN